MVNLFIDPYLIACPQIFEKEKFEEYLYKLLDWEELKTADWINLYMLRETHDVLWEHNKYPIWDDLKIFIKKFEIDYIQPKDVVALVDSFLHKTTKIQDYLFVSDYLYDIIKVEPAIQNRDKVFIDKAYDLLNFAGLKCIIDKEEANVQYFVISSFDSANITFSSTINYIEFSVLENSFVYPLDLSYNYNCCESYKKLCLQTNYSKLWLLNNKKPKVLYQLIYLNTIKMARELGRTIEIGELKEFHIGKSFFSDLVSLHFDNNEEKITILLRAISEELLRVNMIGTHALRNGKGANNEQIVVDGFKANRRDIDYEYHLHYWDDGNKIILSNVVLHNDFDISKPDVLII